MADPRTAPSFESPAGRPLYAERNVIAAAMMERRHGLHARACLPVDAFWSSQHADIWACIVTILDAGKTPDPATLVDELRRQKKLDRIGGIAFLDFVLDCTSILIPLDQHIQAILDDYAVRGALIWGTEAGRLANDGAGPVEVGACFRRASEACTSSRHEIEPGAGLRAVLDGTSVEGIDIPMAGRPDDPAEDLGRMLGQVRMGQVVVVGAEPSAGKTAFGVSLAMALDGAGVKSAYISTEETAEEIECRKAAILAWVPYRSILARRMSDDERRDVEDAYDRIRQSLCRTWHCPGAVEHDVLGAVSRAIVKDDARVIIVDYIQDIGPTQQSRETGDERISRFMRGLAATIGRSACAVVMSQFSRDRQMRGTLDSLKGSSAIGIKGRKALFLVTGKKEERGRGGGIYKREITFDLVKNSNGPTGKMPGWFYLPFSLCWPGQVRPEWASTKREAVQEEPWQRPMFARPDEDDDDGPF